MRKRNHQVIVRLNDREMLLLKKKVSASGLTFSEIVRRFITDTEIKTFPSEELRALLSSVSKIGGNINQIARVANSTQGVDATMLTNASFQVDRLWRLLKDLETWR